MTTNKPAFKPVNGPRLPNPCSRDGEKNMCAAERRIRVLVADDHAVTRLGLIALMQTRPNNIEVVGESSSCLDCCEKAAALSPDVILLDLEMGDCSGIQALHHLKKANPEAQVIICSGHVSACLVTDAIEAGAQGYVPKDAPPQNLLEAVRVVSRGGSYLDPSVSSVVMGKLSRRNGRQFDLGLSARERSVLHLLAEGKRNKDIADTLCISERTVKFHVSALMQKLGAENRTEAVTNAIGQGLVGS